MINPKNPETETPPDFRVLVPDFGRRELRVPGTRAGTCSGFYDDPDKFATDAELADMSNTGAPGVYFTINPVTDERVARAFDKDGKINLLFQGVEKGDGASDEDIERRERIPIDVDPVKDLPKGVEGAATAEEHEAALAKSTSVAAYLSEMGYPEPDQLDSGNGGLLFYRSDLPNTPEITALIADFYAALAARFNDDRAKIDTSVHNASRIMRVPGTLNAKGQHTRERPHRRARILSVPDKPGLVTEELLRLVASEAPSKASSNGQHEPAGDITTNVNWMRAWLDKHGLEINWEGPWKGGYGFELVSCPIKEAPHSSGDGKAFVGIQPTGAKFASCRAESCGKWGWSDLRDKFEPPGTRYDPGSLSDSHLGTRVAVEYLAGTWVSWGKSAWSRWDGRRWDRATDTTVLETVRRALLDIHAKETKIAGDRLEAALAVIRTLTDQDRIKRETNEAMAAHIARLKALGTLLNIGKMTSVMRLSRGAIEVRQEDFDSRADLLNVGNGVVDLATGELLPHSPEYLFTKITEVEYHPGATHSDWTKALTAMPDETRVWMQARFGQAATGHATNDDIVPFLTGGGSNGKSTVLAGVTKALGDFATMIPDKVLLGSPNDHTTELMTLKGARLAFIEELPEGDYLNASRLKKAVGTDMFTARYIAQDNVSWWATHSLMVTTNHTVQIDEATDGIWRRVALVPFPCKYLDSKSKDATLRDRVKGGADGQHEAALAWIITGARAWYDNHRALPEMPANVREASLAWRYESNHAARFLEDTFKLDAGSAVRTGDVFHLFQEWTRSHGLRPWNDQTFWKRATQHDWFKAGKVAKERPLTPDGWNIQRVRWESETTARPALLTGVEAVGVPDSPFQFGGAT